jgi:hypothetical protein
MAQAVWLAHAQGVTTPLVERQDEPRFLKLRCASSLVYRRSGWAHQVRTGVIVALAAAGPLLTWLVPKSGIVVAAVTGLWLLIDRLLLEACETSQRSCGALLQEQHDVGLFDLAWNAGLAGPDPGPDLAERLARRWPGKRRSRLKHWYPDVSGVVATVGVLLCQRVNAVWARQDHLRYAQLVTGAAFAWLIALIVVACASGDSTLDALVLLFLPSVPAFLQAIDLSRAHRRLHVVKEEIRLGIDKAKEAAKAGRPPSASRLRAIQDELFLSRRDGVQVPRWMYRFMRSGQDADMHAVTAELIREMPAELRASPGPTGPSDPTHASRRSVLWSGIQQVSRPT